jgi:hypothetical protein
MLYYCHEKVTRRTKATTGATSKTAIRALFAVRSSGKTRLLSETRLDTNEVIATTTTTTTTTAEDTIVKVTMELAPITASIHRPPAVKRNSDPSLWDGLVPKLWDNPRGVDVRVYWTTSANSTSRSRSSMTPSSSSSSSSQSCSTNCEGHHHSFCSDVDYYFFEQVAAKLLHQIDEQQQYHYDHPLQHNNEPQQRRYFERQQRQRRQLAASMQYFTAFCHQHLDNDIGSSSSEHHQQHEFTARLVASRGAATSIKCPLWHQDHVPIRWIQALTGPGCQYIDPADIVLNSNSSSLKRTIGRTTTHNNDDDDDDDDYNANDDDDDNEVLLLSENIVERNKCNIMWVRMAI